MAKLSGFERFGAAAVLAVSAAFTQHAHAEDCPEGWANTDVLAKHLFDTVIAGPPIERSSDVPLNNVIRGLEDRDLRKIVESLQQLSRREILNTQKAVNSVQNALERGQDPDRVIDRHPAHLHNILRSIATGVVTGDQAITNQMDEHTEKVQKMVAAVAVVMNDPVRPLHCPGALTPNR